MKRYTLVLNFGYVESARLSWVPWTSKERFKDAKAALLDLANYLKEQYLLAPKRGISGKYEEFPQEDFEEWITDMASADTDAFHGAFIEYDAEARWEPGNLDGAPNPRCVYQAAWVILAALGYSHDGKIFFEDICNARTKNKSNSFEYY